MSERLRPRKCLRAGETFTQAERLASFWAKTMPDDGCIRWVGAMTLSGYGNFWTGATTMVAHRWIYIQLRGPIQPGLELDHLCRNRTCVNIDHLEAVTHRVNCVRGIATYVNNSRARAKTHCPRKHSYSGENLVLSKDGRRSCRVCRAARLREFRQRRKAELCRSI